MTIEQITMVKSYVTQNRVKLDLELDALLFILYENHLGCATRVYGNPVVIQ